MNIALLHQLRAGAGEFLALEQLGQDVATVHRDLAELIAFGLGIELHPIRGAAYRQPAERLCPDQIEWNLASRRLGRRIAVWSRVASTNDLAARASGSRSNEGLVILAEEQTAGRGQPGRSWLAPRYSSVLMSVLMFPPGPLDYPAWLTALGAVAAAEVVTEHSGLPAQIKWPNDVRVCGRKIAGVLVERSIGSVLGIGLNVNLDLDQLPPELRPTTTSLQALTGAPVDRSEVARALIERLDAHYTSGVEHGPQALSAAWQNRLEALGQPVRVQTASGLITGRLVGADLIDGLVVEPSAGDPERIALEAVRALSLST